MKPWGPLAALVVTASTLKATGPLIMGYRRLPATGARFVEYLAPTLLTALVTAALLGREWRAANWTQIAGVAVALALRMTRLPVIACVLAAVSVTAALRYLIS